MARLQGNDKEMGQHKKGGAHAENKLSGSSSSSKGRTAGGSSKRSGGEGRTPTPRRCLPTPASSHAHQAYSASEVTVTWLGAPSSMSEGVEGGEHVSFFRACTITSHASTTQQQYAVGELEPPTWRREMQYAKGMAFGPKERASVRSAPESRCFIRSLNTVASGALLKQSDSPSTGQGLPVPASPRPLHPPSCCIHSVSSHLIVSQGTLYTS